MSRTRMDWDWIGEYPIFVLTNWIDHGKFKVRIVKGIKGNQNALNPNNEEPFMEYESNGLYSKDAVVTDALKRARKELD